MGDIIFPVLLVFGLGLICAAVLAVASRLMYVPVDETQWHIRQALPGANCGSCGFAGCDGYADALASNEDVPTNLCTPGGDSVSRLISDLLGLEFSDVAEMVAYVQCGGCEDVTGDKMDYEGIMTCAAAGRFFGGTGKCSYGCIGYGDCASACPNGAIYYDRGVARVNSELCIGCGLCAAACPKNLIVMLPDTVKTAVTCKNNDKAAKTRAVCSAGCLACGKCVRECPDGAILVRDKCALIDYDRCSSCGHCAEVCPTKCIRLANFSGAFNKEQAV